MSNQKVKIDLLSDKLYFTGRELANPNHARIIDGVNVVIGANGSGKSTLGEILEKGWNFRTNRLVANVDKPQVRKIEFSDIHSLSGMKVEYYQQRYEATMNDDVPTVGEILGQEINSERYAELSELFSLRGVADKKINYLSSGELRKLLIINTLLHPTDVLILDNPYIGLDAPSRRVLDEALEALDRSGVTIVLLVANPEDVPAATASVIPMKNMTIGAPIAPREDVRDLRASLYRLFDYAVDIAKIPAGPTDDTGPVATILKLEDCKVAYGKRVILEHIDWEVGDRQYWALSGPNGSGKSTLLSLVCADNPQAYSNSITLFDRRRGSGESIWDIKRRIGYISPEMSLHFKPSADVKTVVAQGLNDTTGVFIQLKPGQAEIAARWLETLHMEHLADRQFSTLSSGERQMAMLARVLIKQPRLMILDEPFHGLDYARSRAVRAIVNYFAARSDAYPTRWPMSIIFVTHYVSEMPECVTFTKTL